MAKNPERGTDANPSATHDPFPPHLHTPPGREVPVRPPTDGRNAPWLRCGVPAIPAPLPSHRLAFRCLGTAAPALVCLGGRRREGKVLTRAAEKSLDACVLLRAYDVKVELIGLRSGRTHVGGFWLVADVAFPHGLCQCFYLILLRIVVS